MNTLPDKIPGRKLILIPGILYLVLAGLNVIFSSVGILTADYWDRVWPIVDSWATYYSWSLMSSLFISVPVGVIGIANCNKLENISLVQIMAWICIVRAFAWLVFDFIIAADEELISLAVYGIYFRLIFPTLYLIGASNKKKFLRSNRNTYPDRWMK